MTKYYEYKIGGSLPEDAPSYVFRQADSDFYQWLKDGELCYVFNSRQMGKTSLLVRTMKKLEAEDIACTTIDVSGRGGKDITPEQWYAGIFYTLVTDFEIGNAGELLRSWWRERSDISPVQRLDEFIEKVLLSKLKSNIVIFIDEIDSILSLNFSSEDFFAWIRSCYEKRTRNPEYKRLTFALLGVATPSNLIPDKRRTPFNIGWAIQLNGFQLHEVSSLVKGLKKKAENPETVLKEILSWTGGQPFLTQKVCKLLLHSLELSQNSTKGVNDSGAVEEKLSETQWVEKVVKKNIIENWESRDEPPHLKTIRDRILMRPQLASRLLGLYQQILQQGEIKADDSDEQIELRLSGLVVKREGKLKVYNRIYQTVFNLTWIEKALADLRPYAEALTAWSASECEDESRLLRGQALQDALKWSAGKSLSNLDYQFLATSQELEKKEVEKALAIKEEESRILAEVNRTLTQAQRKAKIQIRIGGAILIISLGIASMLVFTTQKQKQREQQFFQAQDNLNRYLQKLQFNQEINLDAFIVVMEHGQRLKKILEHEKEQQKNILTTIFDNIYKHTQLNGQKNVSVSPDGKHIVITSEDKTASIWDSSGKSLVKRQEHRYPVHSASFSPDGNHIITLSWGKTILMWNTSGKLLATLQGHQASVNDGNFSPDGQLIVTASDDKTAKIWNLRGQLLTTLKGHQGYVNSVSFSPNGQRVVTTSVDKTAKIWNLRGKLLVTLKGHRGSVNDVSFSPSGQHVVTASADKTAIIWDFSGKLIAKLQGHQGYINSVNFSPNGQQIITASADKIARIWDLSGKSIVELQGHQHSVNSASFSPNGQRVVTTSWDKTVRVWNLSGKLLAEFTGDQGGVGAASFSPDGESIVTPSRDRTARVWYLPGTLLFEPQTNRDRLTASTTDELFLRGCYWLKDYFLSHPDQLDRLKVCQLKQ